MKYEQKNGLEIIDKAEKKQVFDFFELYKKYIDNIPLNSQKM